MCKEIKDPSSSSVDWHRADVIAALSKKGLSLARLSRDHGLASSTLRNVLSIKWPKGERIVADALNVHPSIIWPTRYPK